MCTLRKNAIFKKCRDFGSSFRSIHQKWMSKTTSTLKDHVKKSDFYQNQLQKSDKIHIYKRKFQQHLFIQFFRTNRPFQNSIQKGAFQLFMNLPDGPIHILSTDTTLQGFRVMVNDLQFCLLYELKNGFSTISIKSTQKHRKNGFHNSTFGDFRYFLSTLKSISLQDIHLLARFLIYNSRFNRLFSISDQNQRFQQLIFFFSTRILEPDTILENFLHDTDQFLPKTRKNAMTPTGIELATFKLSTNFQLTSNQLGHGVPF